MAATSTHTESRRSDVALVGGGIMSANLAAMLKELEPRLSIRVFELGAEPAREASDGWNNAGTGHAGLCEISYTPDRGPDGRVPIDRAISICEQFEHSKQFWAHCVEVGILGDPAEFVLRVPHICFVQGPDDVALLEARHAAMREHHFFHDMRVATDPAAIARWMPLVMEGRPPGPVAATRAENGTEVNFGALARRLFGWLAEQEGCTVSTGCRVTGLRPGPAGRWRISVTRTDSGERFEHEAGFIFLGAGGGCVPLLQSAGVPEAAGIGGFPIGGQWLVCDDQAIACRHDAKVYGTVAPESPRLGAPHLDIRRLEARPQLLFGPYASWTTRFLKHGGHWTDLPGSLTAGNVPTLLRAGIRNRSLVRYLVDQGLQGMDRRITALRQFYPLARPRDWRLVEAGIRVQAIKRSDRGEIFFGTEVFTAAGGTLAALLGASPGASVSVNIALETVRRCLPHLLGTTEGRARMRRMIPAHEHDIKLPGAAAVFAESSRRAEETLRIVAPHDAAAGG